MGGSMHNEPKLPPHICLNHNKLNNKQFFMSRREPALLEKTMQSQLKFPDPEWTNSHLHTIRDDGWLVDMKHYSIVFKFPSWLLYLLLAQLVVCSVGLAPITWREMPSFLSRPWCRLQVHAGADAENSKACLCTCGKCAPLAFCLLHPAHKLLPFWASSPRPGVLISFLFID
jgi:hypothetical protein